MAKVVVIDHYKEYAEMMTTPLVQAGHAVVIMIPPLNFERVMQVQPEVLAVGIYRQRDAFDRPIRDHERDICGYEVLKALEDYPAINLLPIVLTAVGLVEHHIPTTLQYDVFLTLPDDLPRYAAKVDDLRHKPKGRHRISGLCCPICVSRLVTPHQGGKELVCPRCDTVVVLEDDDRAFYMPAESPGESIAVRLADLQPPSPDGDGFPNS